MTSNFLAAGITKKASGVRLIGDPTPRPIDVGSLAVALAPAGIGRDALTWTESGARHHAPLCNVVEITEEA